MPVAWPICMCDPTDQTSQIQVCGCKVDVIRNYVLCGQVREDGGVEFINEGSGARLRIFAALKHRFLKQVLHPHPPPHMPDT